MDELRLSDTVRYPGKFKPPAAPFARDGNTMGLWHFDEGQGTLAADASGHNNTGTLHPDFAWGAGYGHNPAGPATKR